MNIKEDTELTEIIKEKSINFNKNNFKTAEIIFLIIITSIISLIMGYLLNDTNIINVKEDEYIEEFIGNYNYIVDNYYEDVDREKLLSGAIDGMLEALDDDYSTLIEEDNGSSFYINLKGSYEGLGVEIYNNDNNDIVVLDVLENSPAEKAGIQSADVIKMIDEKDLTNTNIKELTNYVQRNPKANYLVTIERNGSIMNFTIERSTVTIKSVASKLIEKDNHKVGYIYISVFSNTTESQFITELNKLEKQGMESLIIDVRENSGGHLTTVYAMLSDLMDSSHIIYQIEKDGETEKYYSDGRVTKDYPIVVIQNKNSASASELLSAALKESYGAIVVGEYSYGKGTVQEVVSLSSGDTYKFTTKKWLTPDGNWIHKVGVKPDIEVSLNEKYVENPIDENDDQLQTAINILIK